MYENLPQDPVMLMSFVNQKLRDSYPSLEVMCEDMDIDKNELLNRLKSGGYEYNEQQNKIW